VKVTAELEKSVAVASESASGISGSINSWTFHLMSLYGMAYSFTARKQDTGYLIPELSSFEQILKRRYLDASISSEK
jgi:hypothetical protein